MTKMSFLLISMCVRAKVVLKNNFVKILITVRKLIIKTGTNRFPFFTNSTSKLHVRDDRVAEL